MTIGDRVTIYEDPITQCKPEGIAKLIKPIDQEWDFWDGKTIERWVVAFPEDHGDRVERNILVA